MLIFRIYFLKFPQEEVGGEGLKKSVSDKIRQDKNRAHLPVTLWKKHVKIIKFVAVTMMLLILLIRKPKVVPVRNSLQK